MRDKGTTYRFQARKSRSALAPIQETNMFRTRRSASTSGGQALVEFALIILVLLFLIFVIIEGARILQANLTAQNAARAAGRYAITGQYDPTCLADAPPCDDPRVESIKAVAQESLAGLNLDEDAEYEDPNYYLVEVVGTDESGDQIPDYAGEPGQPVMVRITYRVGTVTPLIRPIAETVRVIGQVVMTNERYTQLGSTSGEDDVVDQVYNTPGPTPTSSPPDLELVKHDAADPVVVDVPFDYVFDVINHSPNDATGVTITDPLPEGIIFDGSSGCLNDNDPSIYNSGRHEVSCELGDIDGNRSASASIRVHAEPSVGDSVVTNVATVDYPGDPVPENNSEDETTEILAASTDADLAISKGASDNLVAVSDEVVFGISVINNGPLVAENTVLTDVLPSGFGSPSITASQGTCGYDASNATVSCQLGNVDVGGNASVSIRVQALDSGEKTNTASVTSNQDDPTPNNNEDTATVTVENSADMGITAWASENPGVEDEMTYTLSVVNNGPTDATGVTVSDSLPASVTYTGYDSSQGSCSASGNVVTCNLGTVAEGGTASIQLYVVPSEEGTITNSASVTAAENDPYTPNNSFSLDTLVQSRADLSISKEGPSTAVAGEVILYTITVANQGPSTAKGVVVEDTLPESVSFVRASATAPSQTTCSGNNSAVSCGLGDLPVNETATVQIWIIPKAGGSIVNSATVTAETVDPDESNNTSTATTDVDGDVPYIIVTPICGDPGTQITISGYNWQDKVPYNDTITLSWDGTQIATVPRAANWTTTITIPSGATEGEHTIVAHQGRAGNQEGIFADAIVTVPCPAPNLVISQLRVVSPAQIVAGEPVVFEAQVSNVGNLDAVSQFFAGLYFDPTPTPQKGVTSHISQDFRQALVGVNGLAAGASKTVTFTVEDGFESGGNHVVYAVADSDPGPYGVIDVEEDELDNISDPLQVSVSVPTPTPVPTGPAPTPTNTPTPEPEQDPGTLVITVFTYDGQPQANARIEVIDESDGSTAAVGYSDLNGTHLFPDIPAGTYSVTACVTVENIDYYSFVTGIPVTSNSVTHRVLFLTRQPGACK